MALGEMEGARSDAEEGGSQEAGDIHARNILESFTESREVRALVGSLRGAFGDLVAREKAVEKFVGKRLAQRERVPAWLTGIYYQKRTKILILHLDSAGALSTGCLVLFFYSFSFPLYILPYYTAFNYCK